MQIEITSNAPKFFKKVQKDLNEFNSGIGRGAADLTNLAFKEIREKKLIQGKYSDTETKIGNPTNRQFKKKRYGSFPGANKKDRQGRAVFHKTKIVNRSNKFKSRFNTISWSKARPFVKTVSRGNNGSNDVQFKIEREGKTFISRVIYTGKTRFLLGSLQYGTRSSQKSVVHPGKSLSEKPSIKVGQRRGVANGYRAALRKWNKVVKGIMDGVVRKAGSI